MATTSSALVSFTACLVYWFRHLDGAVPLEDEDPISQETTLLGLISNEARKYRRKTHLKNVQLDGHSSEKLETLQQNKRHTRGAYSNASSIRRLRDSPLVKRILSC